MRPKRPLVSPEDQALFLSAIQGVKPLGAAERDRVIVPPPPPSPIVRVETPPAVKLAIEGDARRYTARAPGVSYAQTAELRAGKLHVEETLDLHGETIERALERLRAFLAQAARVRRLVLVIHGKGTHSETGHAPMREAVLHELIGPLSGYVHALATAAPAHGGEGATYIMLKVMR
jgi:DNA-nicking Smr family endonuclease